MKLDFFYKKLVLLNFLREFGFLVNEKGDLTESNPRSQKVDFTCQILYACNVHFYEF